MKKEMAKHYKTITTLIGLAIVFSTSAQSNLNVSPNAEINVSNNWVLTVEGGITNDGQMTIESGSSLIQTHAGLNANTMTGQYTVNRVGGNSATSYNIWSSPVMAAPIHGAGAVYDGTNPCDIYTFNGSTQLWKYDYVTNYSATCMGNSVVFGASQLMTDGTADNIMDPTRGYFIPGDATPQRVFDGEVNNGDLNSTIYSTSISTPQWTGTNWNLIGNPYPSAIDLTEFWNVNTASGAISDGIYFWNDPGAQPYDACSDYVVWNSIGAVGSCGGSFNSSGVVSSGQGFWVYAGALGTGTDTVVFNNAMRLTANNTNFYKTIPTFERVWLSVSRNNRVTNQILLGLKEDATVGYDPKYDARKLPESSTMELAFVQDSGIYLILAQPTISYNEQEELPLYLNTDSAGIHVFAFDSVQNVTGGNKYYLIDKKRHITHDLSSPYSVQLAAGEYQNRFYLLYTDVVNGINEGATQNLSVNVFQSGSSIELQSNKIDLKTVTVYSAVGAKMLHKNQIKSPSISIPVQHLAVGVYFVNYQLVNGDTDTKKVIITK